MAAIAILALSYANLGVLIVLVLFYISIIELISWQGIALTQRGPTDHENIGWEVYLFLLSDWLLALNKFYIPIEH